MAATWAMTLPRGPGSQDPNRRPPCSFFQSATAQPAWCSHLVCSRAFAGPRCRVARTRCGPSANAATPAYRASTARGRSSSPDGESHLCLWNRTWAYHRSGQGAMRVSGSGAAHRARSLVLAKPPRWSHSSASTPPPVVPAARPPTASNRPRLATGAGAGVARRCASACSSLIAPPFHLTVTAPVLMVPRRRKSCTSLALATA